MSGGRSQIIILLGKTMTKSKVVISAAVMDLCHKGHLNVLKAIREEAGIDGWTVMVIHDDKNIYDTKGKIPIQNLQQRMENIKLTGLIDEVLPTFDYLHLAKTFEYIIEKYAGAEFVFMRGDDWNDFPASHVIRTHNIPIKFIPYTEGVSSTYIREQLETKYGRHN